MTIPTTSNARLHYIPWGLFFFFPISFLICYLIAVLLQHIDALFAFISDAGTIPPEQCVFSQLVNIGAAVFAYFVYIRFKQIEQYFHLFHNNANHILNVIGLAFGFISALGMSIVGNFPELVAMWVHLFGAFLAFVGGSIYIVFQGYFTFLMLPHFTTKFVAYIRVFLGIFGIMMYFGAHTTLIMAFEKTNDFERYQRKGMAVLKWDPKDKGYYLRAASVVMEWVIVVIFDLFIITFVSEFKKFVIEEPQCKFLFILMKSEGANDEEEQDLEGGRGEKGDYDDGAETIVSSVYTADYDAESVAVASPIMSSQHVLVVDSLKDVKVV